MENKQQYYMFSFVTPNGFAMKRMIMRVSDFENEDNFIDTVTSFISNNNHLTSKYRTNIQFDCFKLLTETKDFRNFSENIPVVDKSKIKFVYPYPYIIKNRKNNNTLFEGEIISNELLLRLKNSSRKPEDTMLTFELNIKE